MRNIFLVIKHEITTMLSKRSFWIMTFIFPLVILALTLGVQIFAGDAAGPESLIPSPEEGAGAMTIGYVDEAGLIDTLPPAVPADLLQAYPDQAAAGQALAEGAIDRYFVVPAGYVETGDITLIQRQFQPLGNNNDDLMRYVLYYNLTGNAEDAAAMLDPTPQLQTVDITATGAADDGAQSPLAAIVPFAVLFIFFFLLTSSSGFMLRSVSREKENRTVEVLLVSLSPHELMLGKILGLCLIALFQMAAWVGGGMLVLNRGTQLLDMASGLSLPDGFLVWAVLYFLLGYVLYGSIMGAIGALAPDVREASQFTFLVLLPLMIPLWMNTTLVNAPNGTLSLVLSLFPLTAPTAMMTRVAATSIPLWQPLASLAGLAVTTYLFILLSARFFRADTLLSGAPLRWRRFIEEFR